MASSYRNDPRWIDARFAGTCDDCAGPIPKGARAYYFPLGHHIYCSGCGDRHYRVFRAQVADEDFYNGLRG